MRSEPDLVEACLRGDREAQRELYEKTVTGIYRVLLRMTRSEETATDLAQETYLRAFSRISEFSGRASVATWIYRIAVNEALQYLRRKKRERAQLQSVPSRESSSEPPSAQFDVREALGALDPGDQAILLLRYEEGLDYRALAEVLECEMGTVASRLNRARERLRRKLSDSYDSEEENSPRDHLIT